MQKWFFSLVSWASFSYARHVISSISHSKCHAWTPLHCVAMTFYPIAPSGLDGSSSTSNSLPTLKWRTHWKSFSPIRPTVSEKSMGRERQTDGKTIALQLQATIINARCRRLLHGKWLILNDRLLGNQANDDTSTLIWTLCAILKTRFLCNTLCTWLDGFR